MLESRVPASWQLWNVSALAAGVLVVGEDEAELSAIRCCEGFTLAFVRQFFVLPSGADAVGLAFFLAVFNRRPSRGGFRVTDVGGGQLDLGAIPWALAFI